MKIITILLCFSKKGKIETNYLEENNVNKIEKEEIEADIIYLNNFNLRVGCPMNMEIKAGYSEEKLIEVRYPNSILYIAFNTVGFNINFHLIKFLPNLENDINDLQKYQYEQQQYFYEMFKIEKIEGSKIVVFVKNPGYIKLFLIINIVGLIPN